MRERITLIHSPEEGVDPAELVLEPARLKAPAIGAAREDRLTAALDELPSHVSLLLQDFQTLHAFTSVASKNNKNTPRDAHYFYQILDHSHLILKAYADICGDDEECRARARELNDASSLEFAYDAEKPVAKITAFWPLEERTLDITSSDGRRTEVGIMARGSPPSMEEHDIGLGGITLVLGDSKRPSPTLFKFAERHRSAEQLFQATFTQPTGLHPAIRISLSGSQAPAEDCRSYAFLTLPKTIFADRYQLHDNLFMASKNLTALRHASLPVDLEAPAYTTETWGSNILVELAPPSTTQEEWAVEVPLHLRYLEPSATGERDIHVAYPVVFWACPVEQGTNFAINPFDKVGLGYDDLFDDDTVYWHVTPQPASGGDGRLVTSITVPVVDEKAASWVGVGTAVVVGLGFLWVLWQLVRAQTNSDQEARAAKVEKKSR
ncbi:uncharacterized protein J7T54_000812 [Emericellopsis cladophorae]|uniref:Protein PBN1 n=1 Tax=Emericellopsis cladophorae TaxID=2686198 RepID=A0A9P9XV83_9HYPO|nr:uncharacterized protein J7T54_000812 [Emericellopsis cladophorae]KAI6778423.1 hypothetical protein J7T54_000812 [Emericellopsis cladophorae]